ncbi:MAG: transglutaminase-like domain-containing protein [Candidatus Azambacteria bacterium]|nr:transglutaminase-like domain-containing protein [Candidatus Azambacteria bacterium]
MKTIKILKKIHLNDYASIKSPYTEVFGLMKGIPEKFYKECLPLNPNSDLENFLRKINFVIHKNADKKKRNAKSFEESRFLTARQILKRGIVSCGAKVTLFAAVLRKRGIPTKLVHGKLTGSQGDNRHAWIKIYDPLNKNYLIVDVTQKNFSLHLKAHQIKKYHDWSKLKRDYKKGKW